MPESVEKTLHEREEIQIGEHTTYYVEYVPREEIYPAFGYAEDNVAKVRADLPPKIQRFVKAHELYHLTDTAEWGGWIGREIRANLIPGIQDPLGLIATIRATLFSKDRILFYLDRIRNGY